MCSRYDTVLKHRPNWMRFTVKCLRNHELVAHNTVPYMRSCSRTLEIFFAHPSFLVIETKAVLLAAYAFCFTLE